MATKAEFWLFRRAGEKRWTFAWAPAPRKRRQVTLPEEVRTKAEANRYARDNLDALRAEKPKTRARRALPAANTTPIAELHERWIAMRKQSPRLRSGTIAANDGHMRTHIVPAFGDRSIESLDGNAADLIDFVHGLEKGRDGRKALAPYSMRNVLNSLASFVEEAKSMGWAKCSINPALMASVRNELPPARPRAGRSSKLHLTLEQAQSLITCAPVPMIRRVRYLLTLTTGLRDGEVSALTWADVDLEASPPVVHVTKALVQKGPDGHASIGDPKSFDSIRDVPLHPAAVAALREWQRSGWGIEAGRKRTQASAVFPGERKEFTLPDSARLARADLARAGMPTHVGGHPLTFHSTRRSFSSWLLAAEAPSDARDVLLGHAPKSTGSKHYAEADLGVLAGYVARIGLVWLGQRVGPSGGPDGSCGAPPVALAPTGDGAHDGVAAGNCESYAPGSHMAGDLLNRREAGGRSRQHRDNKPTADHACGTATRVATRPGTRPAVEGEPAAEGPPGSLQGSTRPGPARARRRLAADHQERLAELVERGLELATSEDRAAHEDEVHELLVEGALLASGGRA